MLVSGLLLSVAVLMVIGCAVDIGHAFIVRRELVAAADDAALTGAQPSTASRPPGSARARPRKQKQQRSPR